MSARHPPSPPQPAGTLAEAQRVFVLLALLPVEDLERLARTELSKPALQRRREAERDACYRALAVFIGSLTSPRSGRDLARHMHRALDLYAHGAWHFERDQPAPDDPVRGLMHRALTLDHGRVLSERSIRRRLAGKLGHG
jgi:hypothetical protein